MVDNLFVGVCLNRGRWKPLTYSRVKGPSHKKTQMRARAELLEQLEQLYSSFVQVKPQVMNLSALNRSTDHTSPQHHYQHQAQL